MAHNTNIFFVAILIAVLSTGCGSKQTFVDSPTVDTPTEASAVKQLKLDDTETDDAALEKICRKNPELIELMLGGTKITDAGLTHLPQLTKLKKIRLSNVRITDAGMVALAKCERLEHVDVSQTKIGDDGVGELAALPRLKRLNLYLTLVTDTGLRSFCKANPKIEWLNLDKCPITDDGLASLASLTALAWLHLGGTAITDTGLDTLAMLESLKTAIVTKTETTLEGIEKLRQTRPDMKVADNISEKTPPEDVEEAANLRKQLTTVREKGRVRD